MAGLERAAPVPTRIVVHKKSRVLEIEFDDGATFRLPFEFLRVSSPSAEVRGHGAGQEVLQTGKRDVDVASLEPVGNYAVQPTFSDGHATGIYSWDYLYTLGRDQQRLWSQYLQRLEAAGASRDAAAADAGPAAVVPAAGLRAAPPGSPSGATPPTAPSGPTSLGARSVSRPRS